MRSARKFAKHILLESSESDWDTDQREKRERRKSAESARFSVDCGL